MSKERRLFSRAGATIALTLALAPMLAACGGAAATATPPPITATNTTAAGETPTQAAMTTSTTGGTGTQLKVGLVTDVGRLNDKSFNQSSWEGVQQAQQQLGIEAKAIETTDTKDYAKNIQQFIDNNYNVIVTVGFALGDATTTAAKANPNIKFIGVDQAQIDANGNPVNIPNLAGLVFEEDKAGYLAGALAASISKTNNIGAICGTDAVPPVWRYCEGYKAGAAAINPATTVQVTYHSDVDITKTFVDPEWGKTTALSMISKGADVVFGAGGQTGNGAIYAASEKNIAAIGVDADQYYTIGDQYKSALVSSAMKLLTPGVFNIIKAIQDGTFKSGDNVGTVGLAPYHDWDSKVPQAVKDKMTTLEKGVIDGSIKTCVSPAKGAPSPCGGSSGTPTPSGTPSPPTS